MVNTPTAYSVLHPIFKKATKMIDSSVTVEHLNTCTNYVDNFLTYIEQQEDIGEMPKGYCRTVLATYYGSVLRTYLYNKVI